jgi:Flp pilus assembly protein TadB
VTHQRSFHFKVNNRNLPWPLQIVGAILSLVAFVLALLLGGALLAVLAVVGLAAYGVLRWRLFLRRRQQNRMQTKRPKPIEPGEVIIDV